MVRSSRTEVEWFLELINADLGNSSEDDTYELLNKMIRTFGSVVGHKELNEILVRLWGSEGQDRIFVLHELLKVFMRLQERLKTILDEILTAYKRASQYEGEGNFFNYASASTAADLSTLCVSRMMIEVRVEVRNKPVFSGSQRESGNRKIHWPQKSLTESPLELILNPVGENDDMFIFRFLKAVSGVQSLSHLKKCEAEDCSRWFLQAGKKKRSYCSDKCRARDNNRSRRRRLKEEGGEAYRQELEKERQRAQKTYRKKIKKKTPNALVGKKLD